MFQSKYLDNYTRYEKLQQALVAILKAPSNEQKYFWLPLFFNKVTGI